MLLLIPVWPATPPLATWRDGAKRERAQPIGAHVVGYLAEPCDLDRPFLHVSGEVLLLLW